MTEFHHQFLESSGHQRTLVLLHGTGGDENDMLPLGRAIDDRAALLSPRGQVTENGANRFFRRLAEGVFDEPDLIDRAHELAAFLREAANRHSLDQKEMVLVGYSNGANIATAMMLLEPGDFTRAILFRAMVPLRHPPSGSLDHVAVLLLGGRFDPIATTDNGQALAALLRTRGAEVTVQLQEAGHELTPADVEAAREWLAVGVIA